MKHLIQAVKQKLAAWRHHREDQQFLTGYRWARMAYYEEGWTLEWIEAHEEEFGGTVGPFERGVQQATHELRKFERIRARVDRLYQELTVEHDEVTETNANGEPVGVPYMLELNPGRQNKIHRISPENQPDNCCIDPLKEREARDKEILMSIRRREMIYPNNSE